MKHPQIMAHRGDLSEHSENTLPSFQATLAAGVRHLEFDIQFNADGTPLLLHDPTLMRTYGSKLSIFELSDSYTPSLPTLVEVLDLADRYPDLRLYIEVKDDSLQHWGEASVLENLRPWLKRISRHTVFSRTTDFLTLMRDSGVPQVGAILREWSTKSRQTYEKIVPDLLIVNAERVPAESPLWPGPWQWAVYEIDDYATAQAWAGRGANFALTHYPIRLLTEQQEAMRQ